MNNTSFSGLHNPSRHRNDYDYEFTFGRYMRIDCWCLRCAKACSSGTPCYCCLESEMNLLRAEKAVAEEEMEQAINIVERLSAQVRDAELLVKVLRGQVQRVRDSIHKPWHYPDDACCERVWETLHDGWEARTEVPSTEDGSS